MNLVACGQSIPIIKRNKMIHIKNDLGLAGLYIVFDGSSAVEKKKGTSHLIEHIICKNYDSLLSELSQFAIVSNAYTSNNEVVFWFQGLEESIDKYSQILTDKILAGMTCTKEQFENEKKTVVEEYLDCFNDQSKGHYYNLMREKLNYYGPIGELKDIENFSFEDCQKEIDLKFRVPSRMVLVSKDTKQLYNGEFRPVSFNQDISVGQYSTPIQPVKRDSKTSVLGIFPNGISFEKRFELDILLSCLNDGLEAPLFQEIREKRGLSYFSWTFDVSIGTYLTSVVGACTVNERSNELIEVYQSFFADVHKHLSQERFDIIKQKFLLEMKKQEILRYGNCQKEITNGRSGMDVADVMKLNFKDVADLADEHLRSLIISSY
jgi:predicted Zn-dependent peptidase